MSYGNELVTMLRPLGVYSFREGSFSLAELQALGAALDEADASFSKAQKETIVKSAGDEGLSKWEALFRSRPPAKTVEARRAAIAGFLRISGDSFTLAALNRCLCACGVACSVEETGEVNRVKVWFPGVMGIPDGFSQMKIIIEDILPCQLGIIYWFRYCTWQETEGYTEDRKKETASLPRVLRAVPDRSARCDAAARDRKKTRKNIRLTTIHAF